MKTGMRNRLGRRLLSMALAAASVLSLAVIEPPKAEALRVQPGQNMTTTTNIVIWDYISQMQDIKGNADVSNPNAKYSRVLFYEQRDGDRYFLNASPEGGPIGQSPGYYSNYDEKNIYVDEYAKLSNPAYKEWYGDFLNAENSKGSFISKDGFRTPYIQYAGDAKNKDDESRYVKDFVSWYLWAANKDDTISDYAITLVKKMEDLDVRRTDGRTSKPKSHYGKDNDEIDIAKWIFADKMYIVPASSWTYRTGTKHIIWHFDDDSGGYDESMDLSLNPTLFWAFRGDLAASVDEFDVFLGAEHAVPTLSQNFVVERDQITTLGRPLFYIPKGKKITVRSEGILSVDGILLNDGEIEVEDGGMLILKDGAKIMPFTQYDNGCGTITSQGSVVVQEDSLLCGGGLNGLRIEGGGVVNFGVICAENMTIAQNYAVDNRPGGSVLAGYYPKRSTWTRWMLAAVADDYDPDLDPYTDFELRSDVTRSNNILAGSIYGDNTNVKIEGGTLVGNASNPAVSVYVRNTPNDNLETLFEDQLLSSISMTPTAKGVTFQVGRKSYTVEKKLLSMAVGRGGRERETVLQDVWVGPLDGAIVRMNGVSTGRSDYTLSYNNGEVSVFTANGSAGEWWRLIRAGEWNGETTYAIESYPLPNSGLGVNGESNAAIGKTVELATSRTGRDQEWILADAGGGLYYLRNGANSLLEMECRSRNYGGYYPVLAARNEDESHKWKISLLTQGVYDSTMNLATAVQIVPVSASDQGMSNYGDLGVRDYDASLASYFRWNLIQMGTDNLDGVMKPYYQIVNLRDGRAVDASIEGAAVNARVHVRVSNTSEGNYQFWYVNPQSDGTYTITLRNESTLALGKSDNQVVLRANTGGDDRRWRLQGVTNLAAEVAATTPTETGEDPWDGKVVTLAPRHAERMRLDIKDRKTDNGTQMVLQNELLLESQMWELKRLGTTYRGGAAVPYYQLRSLHADKVLDSSGGTENGSLPHLWEASADNLNAQWIIEDAGEGYYRLSPRNTPSRNLGCEGAGTSSGTRIVLWDKSDAQDQQWKLKEVPAPVTFGTFMLEPKHVADKYVVVYGSSNELGNNGTTVRLYDEYLNENTTTAQWDIIQMGTDNRGPYYKLVNKTTGKALGYGGGNYYSLQWEYDGNVDKLYYLEESSTDLDGRQYYYLALRSDPTKVLEVEGLGTSNRTVVQVSARNGGDNQQFRLAEHFEPVVIGTYEIGHVQAPEQRLDRNNNSNIPRIRHREILDDLANGGDGQRWRIVQRGNDLLNGTPRPYYSIENVSTGRCLDAGGRAGSSAGQYTDPNNKSRHWYLDFKDDSSVIFVSRQYPNLAMELPKTDDDTQPMMGAYNRNNKANKQRWQLHPVMVKNADGTCYIPGSEAAVAAGFPFATESDLPVTSAGGTFYIQNQANTKLTLFGNVSTLTSQSLPDYPDHLRGQPVYAIDRGQTIYSGTSEAMRIVRESLFRVTIEPMGVDYYDGEGKVYYRFQSPYATTKKRVERTTAEMMEAAGWAVVDAASLKYKTVPVGPEDYYSPLGAESTGIAKSGQTARLEAALGEYDEFWYMEEVGGKDNTYYFVARGTWSDPSKRVCLQLDGDTQVKRAAVKTATLNREARQQWTLYNETQEGK